MLMCAFFCFVYLILSIDSNPPYCLASHPPYALDGKISGPYLIDADAVLLLGRSHPNITNDSFWLSSVHK
jgi:hypothetical protein